MQHAEFGKTTAIHMFVRRSNPGAMPALLALVLAACSQAVPLAEDIEPVDADPEQATRTVAPERQGPWRMQCFVEDELVLDLPEVYRVQRETRAGGHVYVTPDGTVIRGRITAGANCVWLAAGDDPPIPDQRPGKE